MQAVDDLPVGVQLLARLVLSEGLTVGQAVAVTDRDFTGAAVNVVTKTGHRLLHHVSAGTQALAARVADGRRGAPLVTGRSGRALSPAAGRRILLAFASVHGVRVRSVHELRAERWVVGAG
jgi:hypothetical protein